MGREMVPQGRLVGWLGYSKKQFFSESPFTSLGSPWSPAQMLPWAGLSLSHPGYGSSSTLNPTFEGALQNPPVIFSKS